MVRYGSLFSGSSGNSTYVGTADGGILVDAGVSAKRIETALNRRDIDPRTIRAVLISHEHSDHISGLRVLCKRYHWPVLASAGTLEALAEGNRVEPVTRMYALNPGEPVNLPGLRLTAFSTPHDSRQCLGFRLETEDGRALAIATDIGYMTDGILSALTGCHLVHIESNHDLTMLKNGSYPYPLKQRILGNGGHLCNDACAAILPELLESGSTRLVLAHLSRENNTPDLARRTAIAALAAAGAECGRDYLLQVASPESAEDIVYF